MHRVLFFVALLAAAHSVATASATDWRWQLNTLYLGTSSGSLDGYDASDAVLAPAGSINSAVYHSGSADGWSGPNGFYSTDLRAPIPPTPGQSKTWTLYVWTDPSCAWDLTELMWGYSSGTHFPAFDRMTYTLTYVRSADGITVGPAVGTSVLLNQQRQGTWSLPVYRTTDGRTGYVFTLTATVIPEPSSLLALAGGLIGLGSMLRRRR